MRKDDTFFKDLEYNEQREWVLGIVDRILEAYKIEGKGKRVQLAAKLGLKDGTIKSWVANRRIPFHAMVTCSIDTEVSFDWLMWGESVKGSPVKEGFESGLKAILTEHLENARRYDLLRLESGSEALVSNIVGDASRLVW